MNHHPQQSHHAQQAQQNHANMQQQYNRLTAVNNASASASNSLAGQAGGEHRAGIAAGEHQGMSDDERKTMEWIVQLLNPTTRETALLELSKKREAVPELALVLWHSFGTLSTTSHVRYNDGLTDFAILGVMTSLLQEIISVYPLLNPSQLTAAASNRVCNALALLQCVASHPETRQLFLSGMNTPFTSMCHPSTNSSISTHSAFPVPIPKHYVQIPPV
jgi:CCR4-NOT transcription complex subunit 9